MFADRLVLLVCLLVVLLVWVWFRWVLGFGLLLVAFCFYVFGGGRLFGCAIRCSLWFEYDSWFCFVGAV